MDLSTWRGAQYALSPESSRDLPPSPSPRTGWADIGTDRHEAHPLEDKQEVHIACRRDRRLSGTSWTRGRPAITGYKFRDLRGGEKMRGRLSLSKRTMSLIIAVHRRERSKRLALELKGKRRFSPMHYVMLSLRRWRERRALSRLVEGVPTTAEEASEKLAYVMAIMIEDHSPFSSEELVQVIDTLRPHCERLAHFIKK